MNSKKYNLINILPYFLFFIGILIFHTNIMSLNITFGDFNGFYNLSKQYTFFQFLKYRYQNWSSRVIIEAVLYFIVQLPPDLFLIFDIILLMLILVVLIKLLNSSNNLSVNFFIVSALFFFDMSSMNTAGWVATILNYMFPLLFLLLSLFPIKNYLLKKETPKWHIIFYSLFIIIAANLEQSAAILFIAYITTFIYMLIKKNIDKTYYIYISIIIASLIYILLCPGNNVRLAEKNDMRVPNFENYTIIHKILNSGCTILYFFLKPYLVLPVFKIQALLILYLIISAIYIFINYKNVFIKLSSFLPLLIFLFMLNSKKIKTLFSQDNININVSTLNLNAFLSFLIFIGFIIIISYNLILILLKERNDKFCLIKLIVLFTGIISMFIMGFSPTCFASNTRTLIFLQFSFIISSTMIFIKIREKNKLFSNYVLVFIMFFAIIYYMQLIFTRM